MTALLKAPDAPADLLGGAPARSRAGRPPQRETRAKLKLAAPATSDDSARAEELRLAQNILNEALAQHPHDLWGQLAYFFRGFRIPAARGRRRAASQKTTEKYVESISVFFQTLRDNNNVRLRNMTEATTKHMVMAIRYWEGQGLSASTLANRHTCIKRYMSWIGRGGGIPALKEALVDGSRGMRTYSAVESKEWGQRGVDADAKIEEVARDCEYTGMHLQLQRAFGLRSTEALCLKPAESDKGTHLLLYRGTKGGRGRSVPIRNEEQRQLLDKARAMANARTGLIGRYGHNLKSAQSHYYYILGKHGISRAAEGITSHGLRHGYANERFQEITGYEAPVQGGARPPRGLEIQARSQITQELGHSRVNITTAYTGSVLHMERVAMKHLRTLMALAEGSALQAGLREAREQMGKGVDISLYIVGPESDGKRQPAGMPLLMALALEAKGQYAAAEDLVAKTAALIQQLTGPAATTFGRPCVISDLRTLAGDVSRLELIL